MVKIKSAKIQSPIRTIGKYLRPQNVSCRTSTISAQFASALSRNDDFADKEAIRNALKQLGVDADSEQVCFYCDAVSTGWDHLNPTTHGKEPSGYGHVLGNLVPCCPTCNSSKGGRHWTPFIRSQVVENALRLRYPTETTDELDQRIRKKEESISVYEKLVRRNESEPNPQAEELVQQIKAARDRINLELQRADELLVQLRKIRSPVSQ